MQDVAILPREGEALPQKVTPGRSGPSGPWLLAHMRSPVEDLIAAAVARYQVIRAGGKTALEVLMDSITALSWDTVITSNAMEEVCQGLLAGTEGFVEAMTDQGVELNWNQVFPSYSLKVSLPVAHAIISAQLSNERITSLSEPQLALMLAGIECGWPAYLMSAGDDGVLVGAEGLLAAARAELGLPLKPLPDLSQYELAEEN